MKVSGASYRAVTEYGEFLCPLLNANFRIDETGIIVDLVPSLSDSALEETSSLPARPAKIQSLLKRARRIVPDNIFLRLEFGFFLGCTIHDEFVENIAFEDALSYGAYPTIRDTRAVWPLIEVLDQAGRTPFHLTNCPSMITLFTCASSVWIPIWIF